MKALENKEKCTKDLTPKLAFKMPKTPKIATSLEMAEQICKDKYGDDYFELNLEQTIERQKEYNAKQKTK